MVQTANEAGWFGWRGVEGRLIVEHKKDAAGFLDLPCQCGLACPSRSDDQNHRGVGEHFVRQPFGEPIVQGLRSFPISGDWNSNA